MARPLTAVIGERSIYGRGHTTPPGQDGKAMIAQLKRFSERQPMFRLKFRGFDVLEHADGLTKDRMWGVPNDEGTRPRLEAAKASRQIEVIMAVEVEDFTGREIADIDRFPTDAPFQVPFAAAARLLQTDPYCTMFEEVDDGVPTVPQGFDGPPPSPADMSRVQSLEQQVAALTALVKQQQTPTPAAAPAVDDHPSTDPDDHPSTDPDDDAPPPPPSGRRRKR